MNRHIALLAEGGSVGSLASRNIALLAEGAGRLDRGLYTLPS
jgi:hypothetical protein